jgi:hypothetical protein
MIEKEFQAMFSTWLALNPPEVSTAYELKICKGKSIGFDHVAEHQGRDLQKVKKQGIYHKISDSPVSWMKGTAMRFGKPKPFDCLWLKGPAYVVVLFYIPRVLKTMVFIDIGDWIAEKNASERKSLTLERAKIIGSKTIAL